MYHQYMKHNISLQSTNVGMSRLEYTTDIYSRDVGMSRLEYTTDIYSVVGMLACQGWNIQLI